MPPKKELPTASQKLPKPVASQVDKRLQSTIDTASKAGQTQEKAEDTRKKLKNETDPAIRADLEKEAKKLEAEAKRQFKLLHRLQSGTWQGGGFGAGIGAGTGLGLGAGVGTLVGGVLAVPTTLVGGLVGAGTGAIHGPWVKLAPDIGGGGKKKEQYGDAGEEKIAMVPEIPEESLPATPAAETTLGVSVPQVRKRGSKAPRKLEIRRSSEIPTMPNGEPKDLSTGPSTPAAEYPGASYQAGGYSGASYPPAEANKSSQPARKTPKKLEVRKRNSSQGGVVRP